MIRALVDFALNNRFVVLAIAVLLAGSSANRPALQVRVEVFSTKQIF